VQLGIWPNGYIAIPKHTSTCMYPHTPQHTCKLYMHSNTQVAIRLQPSTHTSAYIRTHAWAYIRTHAWACTKACVNRSHPSTQVHGRYWKHLQL